MFKIPNNLPSKNSNVEEFCDFLEYQCLKKNIISIKDALKPILLIDDEINIDGIESEEDILNEKIESVLVEIERRKKATDDKYPFEAINKGYTLKVLKKNINYWVYSYLLLSTRMDMTRNKVFNGIDGTTLLEKLSSYVAKEYFGDRAASLIFGTAADLNKFSEKVTEMIGFIGEGHSFLNRDNLTSYAKDDKLDVVVWKDFSDGYRSKVIGFGQCKTGTSWDDQSLIELQPKTFCSKWLRDDPIHEPLKMFFLSQYFPLDGYSKSKNAGIVFDRFRILDYLPKNLDKIFINEIIAWTTAALKYKFDN